MKKNGFVDYMKSIGKLGGQNKVARLGNDRHIAEGLQPFIISSGLLKGELSSQDF